MTSPPSASVATRSGRPAQRRASACASRGEASELLRPGDVAGRARGGIALEQEEAADLHVADEGAQLLVALDLGALKAHQE